MLVAVSVPLFNVRAVILIRRPVTIAICVCILTHPSMNSAGIWMDLLIEVRSFLVVTVQRDLWSSRESLSLGMVLNDLPVFFDGDINIAKLDLSLLLLLNLSKLFPLN